MSFFLKEQPGRCCILDAFGMGTTGSGRELTIRKAKNLTTLILKSKFALIV